VTAVAARARRPCGISPRARARPCAHHARRGGSTGCWPCRPALWVRAIIRHGRHRQGRRWPSGPTCPTVMVARAGRARQLVHARQPGAGDGPFRQRWPGAKGSLLRHEKLIDFIQRNYEHDERGCNGSSRTARSGSMWNWSATPWVWRVGAGMQIAAHTGQLPRSCCPATSTRKVCLPGDRSGLRPCPHPGHGARCPGHRRRPFG
jgi:hypothetical protein